MRYEEYKKCDCGWLDKIPSGWSTIPIKRTVKNILTSFIDGDWIESNVITSDGIRYLTTGNVGALEYKEQGNGHISEETFKELNCSEVFPGDMLISRLNEPIGRTCIVPNIGNRIVVAVDNVIYRPDENKYDKRYLMYQMNCLPYTENANYIARGSTMSRISRTMLGSIKLCIPTLQEQQTIACYLDEKCGKINGAIDVQKKKIDLLNELKQTIITNAVTKGLNPDAPMKDSGVEWIGEIPEHWDMIKIKFNFKIYAGATPKTDVKDYWDGDIIWITPADYKTIDKFISCGQRCITKEGYNTCNTQLVPKGTLIFSKRAPIGTVAIADTELCTNQGCLSCVPQKCSSLYYYYATSVYTEIFDLLGSGATFKEISASDFANVKLPSPDYDEQLAIVSSIEKEVLKIDAQISKANRRIELLNELKQSIITEAVTGKIKVC